MSVRVIELPLNETFSARVEGSRACLTDRCESISREELRELVGERERRARLGRGKWWLLCVIETMKLNTQLAHKSRTCPLNLENRGLL